MLTLQPRPATDAMLVSKLGESVKSWIGQKYPKLADGRLSLIQQALHAYAGPMTCTWASLLDADPGEAVPVEDVLNIIQRTIVLMGNVKALTTQAWQQTVLEAGGKEVAALMKDEMPLAAGSASTEKAPPVCLTDRGYSKVQQAAPALWSP